MRIQLDGAVRFYGVPGQEFGPLNVKYRMDDTDESLVTKVVKAWRRAAGAGPLLRNGASAS